ncbi:MAG: GIN domain-containing protein [Parabacteroides merdae]
MVPSCSKERPKEESLSVAGGGDISAFGCVLRKAECSVAGGGDIEVHASEQLDASIAGGGHIRYEGDPELSKSVIGGGSIKKN